MCEKRQNVKVIVSYYSLKMLTAVIIHVLLYGGGWGIKKETFYLNYKYVLLSHNVKCGKKLTQFINLLLFSNSKSCNDEDDCGC